MKIMLFVTIKCSSPQITLFGNKYHLNLKRKAENLYGHSISKIMIDFDSEDKNEACTC